MAMKTAWLGLGVMGAPMAGHLSKGEGVEVTIFNRSTAKADKWLAAYNGKKADTPKAAVADCDFVFSCVGNDEDLRSITLGADGAFAGMKKGALYVDHTTTSALVAKQLADEAQSRDLRFMDAPVSGGQAGAEKGTLTVMCGGDLKDFTEAEPLIAAYSKMRKLMGPVGNGQVAKMCNQIALAGALEGLSECLHFAMKAGLNVDDLVDTIGKGAAGSWQMENRSKTMVRDEFDFGFAVDLMRKDLSICLAAARENGAHLPVTALVDQFYSEVQSMGGGRWDTSSLIARLNR